MIDFDIIDQQRKLGSIHAHLSDLELDVGGKANVITVHFVHI